MALFEAAARFVCGEEVDEGPTRRRTQQPTAGAASTVAKQRMDQPQPQPPSRFSLLSALPPWRAVLCLCGLSLLFRVLVSGGSFSGEGRPAGSPIGGDYEAQRHWMEITLNLPVQEWYRGSHAANDLQYWGLDYPPLTAYVSLGFGWAARAMGLGRLVELESSRGHESEQGKAFMRGSVLLCEMIVGLPGIILAVAAANSAAAGATSSSSSNAAAARPSKWRLTVLLLLALLQPLLILIDHGHFQYNCVSLGLVGFAVALLWTGREWSGSVCFVLSLTFKQMSLYYAPAFFAYLLARTRVGKGNGSVSLGTSLIRLTLLGLIVIVSFLLLFLPFLSSLSLLAQVLHRLFPFARGLYEDKVANAWCASSVIVKWHLWFARETMVRAALAVTMLSFLPSCLRLYARPSRLSFLYALAVSSFGFYLFSFQVHEKSILLPLLPALLLQGAHPLLASWVGSVATFSCYSLLAKDGHQLSYWILQSMWTSASMGWARAQMMQPQQQPQVDASSAMQAADAEATNSSNWAARLVHKANQHPLLLYRCVQLSLLGGLLVHVVSALLPSLPRYPDLSAMLLVVYAAPHFLLFHAIIVLQQFALPEEAQEDQELRGIGVQGSKKHKEQ